MRWLLPLCLLVATTARAQPSDDPYQHADRAFRAAMQRDDDRAIALEEAASLLIGAVDGAPDDPRAPAALANAAVALDIVGRFESATRVYTRIVDQVAPRAATPETAASLDEILVHAYLRRARLRQRADDREGALADVRAVADGARFHRSTDPEMPGRIDEALLVAADLLVALGRPGEAAPYFARASDRATHPGLRRDLAWAAVLHARGGDVAAARRQHDRFLDRYADDPAARDAVAEARAWLEAHPPPRPRRVTRRR